MNLIRKILFPVVPIYQGVTWIRNWCFDKHIFKSKSYNFPIICVGNLSVGGTGKTPMIEYLVRILKENNKIATLSRGYKRNTKGFQIANKYSSALTVGDEPYQFHQKFTDIVVCVDSDRQNGIAMLQRIEIPLDIILLDDAFQHRKVKAGFNILLTTYDRLYINDFSLPTGDLREPKSGAKRADVIVVTKCPRSLSIDEKNRIITLIKPHRKQQVFFSTVNYSDTIYSIEENKPLETLKNEQFMLVTGIANSIPLLNYLKSKAYNFEHLNFKDHHEFSATDLEKLNGEKLVLTTEKDFMRLKGKVDMSRLYYLPINVEISKEDEFNTIVKQFISSY
jgi:tetraacyldisaccharide 4'-kinase